MGTEAFASELENKSDTENRFSTDFMQISTGE